MVRQDGTVQTVQVVVHQVTQTVGILLLVWEHTLTALVLQWVPQFIGTTVTITTVTVTVIATVNLKRLHYE
jgi:hypothetical protein